MASSQGAGRGRGGGASQLFQDVLQAARQVHVAKHASHFVQRGLVARPALSPGFQHAVVSLAQAAHVLQLQPLDLVLAQPQEPHKLPPAGRRHAVHHRVQCSRVCNVRMTRVDGVFPFRNRGGDRNRGGGCGCIEERVSNLGWDHLPYRCHDRGVVGPVTRAEGGTGGTGDRTEAWGGAAGQNGVDARGGAQG